VAHETVNSAYGITASIDDDIYLGLTGKDPYTSDQQRERDRYEINDVDWHEVVFEEVCGSSTAKFALHIDWIKQKGYQADAVINLDLPEQGISGPFRITSIKHILPQKKPTDDDESDDYDYRPVTAIFTHVSNQVYNISFDNGEELGVTYQHPIYSVTAEDWRLAGELIVGEKVLSKSGVVVVTKSSKKKEAEVVYNLEIKGLHNFLVRQSGIVVHNSYGVLTRIGDYLEFKNPSGTVVKFTRQNNWSERDIIERRNNSVYPAEVLELDAALKLKQSGVNVKAIGMEAGHSSGSPLGEIDIWTNKGMVEVKTHVRDLKVRQMKKYMDPTSPNFINPSKALDVGARKILVYAKNGTPGEIAAKKAEILESLVVRQA
jgi:hypothetical protein